MRKLGAVGLLAASVFVQSAFAVESGTAAEAAVLEEVLVTAQRRAQNPQDVPISMTVLSGDDLRDLNIRSTGELGAHVPNLKVYNDSGENGAVQIVIRGVYSNGQTYMVGPSALVYSDDVLLDSYLSQGVAFFDAQRVEVLKGPQGTLFGRNATSGAVQVISNRPGDDSYAEISLGSYGKTRFEGAVGGELTDSIGIRIAAFYDQKDGWFDNISNGDELYDAEAYALRALLEFTPSDNVDILVKAQYVENDQHPLIWQSSVPSPHPFTGFGFDDSALVNPGPGSDWEKGNLSFSDSELEDTFEDTQFSVTLNWKLGDVLLTSITAYEEYEWAFLNDADSTATAIFHFYNAVDYEGFTQELRLTSQSDSQFQWIVGAFYQDTEMTSRVADDFTDLFVLFGLSDPGNGFGDMDLIDHESESWAIFIHTDYAWTDKFKTTHGVRYTKDELSRVRTALNSSTFPRASRTSFINLALHSDFGSDPLSVNYVDGDEADEITWRLAAEYVVDEDVLLYGSVSTGYKAGALGANWNSLQNQYAHVDPETVLSYELGLKSQWFKQRLMINAAVFLYDYEDYQSATTIGNDFSFSRSDINIPEVEFQGFELEISARPSDNLWIQLGFGYVDAEIEKYASNALVDLAGNRPPRASEMDVSGIVRYDIPLTSGTLSPQIDFEYVGDFYTDSENTLELGDFWRVNARLTYRHESSGFEVNVFVENIGDDKELQNVYAPNDAFGLGTDLQVRDLGRNWGLSVRKSF
ncbi:TonB-dependent receptor [Pseudomonadales bacterium]|nr:TonB-dependent receptor [Pseudomonadales bacterium]